MTHMDVDFTQGWTARYDGTSLRVASTFTFPTSGWMLTLFGGAPDPADPATTTLQLLVTEPDTGEDVEQSLEASWDDELPGQEKVRISTPSGDVTVDVT